METRELIILRYFLHHLESRYRESELLHKPISPSFLHLLSREELVDVLIVMFGSEENLSSLYPEYKQASNETLLFEHIQDEFYILQYFLEKVFTQYLP
ncbi:MAG: hypothetical protein Crog4KO_18990 [Crocinitomicaceae bacterium]